MRADVTVIPGTSSSAGWRWNAHPPGQRHQHVGHNKVEPGQHRKSDQQLHRKIIHARYGKRPQASEQSGGASSARLTACWLGRCSRPPPEPGARCYTPAVMRIAELYASIQGEGRLTGTPSVFVRTSGCNLLPLVLRHAVYLAGAGRRGPGGRRDPGAGAAAGRRRAAPCRADRRGADAPRRTRAAGRPTERPGLAYHHRDRRHALAGCPLRPDVDQPSSWPTRPRRPNAIHAWRVRHECARHAPEVLHRLAATYDYQFKFVVDQPADCDEVERFLADFTELDRRRLFLMPQGTTAEELAGREAWLEGYCQEQQLGYCPRRHIEWFRLHPRHVTRQASIAAGGPQYLAGPAAVAKCPALYPLASALQICRATRRQYLCAAGQFASREGSDLLRPAFAEDQPVVRKDGDGQVRAHRQHPSRDQHGRTAVGTPGQLGQVPVQRHPISLEPCRGRSPVAGPTPASTEPRLGRGQILGPPVQPIEHLGKQGGPNQPADHARRSSLG